MKIQERPNCDTCREGSYLKSVTGTIHLVLKRFDLYDAPDIHSLMDKEAVSGAVPYSQLTSHFGVDKGTIKSHPYGPMTEDSLLKIMP